MVAAAEAGGGSGSVGGVKRRRDASADKFGRVTSTQLATVDGDLAVKKRRGITEVSAAKNKGFKSIKQLLLAENYDCLSLDVPTYTSIEAPPSVKPPLKYCDITGFPAKYVDPKTKLRFSSAEAFRVARSLPEHQIQEHLSVRRAETRIK